MAVITLEPGESFEHYHHDQSESILIEGAVQLSMAQQTSSMIKNQVCSIPAETSHTITNIGKLLAKVACRH